MKKITTIMVVMLIALFGISGTAFAKHHHHHKNEDNKDDNGRKVPCLVKGVRQMVKTEDVCKDFDGTVVTDKTPQGGTAVSKEKIIAQKIQDK